MSGMAVLSYDTRASRYINPSRRDKVDRWKTKTVFLILSATRVARVCECVPRRNIDSENFRYAKRSEQSTFIFREIWSNGSKDSSLLIYLFYFFQYILCCFSRHFLLSKVEIVAKPH